MDKKISQLPGATTPLTGAEELAIVQSGVTKKTTIEDVKGYKVYTALLTQSGSDTTGVTVTSSPLTLGVSYVIDDPASGDFTNVGAPDNNPGTTFVATGTTPNSWGGGSLIYIPAAPVVTVLENTIGNIWFTYNGVGFYSVNSTALFTLNKTWNTYVIALGINGPASRGVLANAEDGNIINIYTESDVDSPSDNVLYNTPIEIRVYN